MIDNCDLRLVSASLSPPPQLRELLVELGDGESGFMGTPFGRGEMTLDEYLQSCCDGSDPAKIKPQSVPQTVFWLLDESGTAIGMVRVRHCLNENLLRSGGHIAYFIRASWRGKGYGKMALRLALKELRKIGEKRALITVDSQNIPSIRTVQACGGELEDIIERASGGKTMRFWVDLAAE